MSNRGTEIVLAYAVIENKNDKIALFSGEVPIFWLRKVAQAKANEFGSEDVHVERIAIQRLRK